MMWSSWVESRLFLRTNSAAGLSGCGTAGHLHSQWPLSRSLFPWGLHYCRHLTVRPGHRARDENNRTGVIISVKRSSSCPARLPSYGCSHAAYRIRRGISVSGRFYLHHVQRYSFANFVIYEYIKIITPEPGKGILAT